jgi:hypothetical protein
MSFALAAVITTRSICGYRIAQEEHQLAET